MEVNADEKLAGIMELVLMMGRVDLMLVMAATQAHLGLLSKEMDLYRGTKARWVRNGRRR
jgi:hypothetical protein